MKCGRLIASYFVAFFIVGLLESPSLAQEQIRIALVIGNSDYNQDGAITTVRDPGLNQGGLNDLPNPINDASDIADSLRSVGFDVTLVRNANQVQMLSAIAQFGARIATMPPSAQVVFFFAGHAIQVNGTNYLLPVGARLPSINFSQLPPRQTETVLGGLSVTANDILAQMSSRTAPGVNLLILDACRDNPWEQTLFPASRGVRLTRGLADLSPNTRRTIIAFSTQPGDVALDGAGRNSPYSAALKREIRLPGTILSRLDALGAEVERVTNGSQIPWFQGTSIGMTCLSDCTDVQQATAPLVGSCDNLSFDLVTGRLNGIPIEASPETVRREFPCFTGQTSEGSRFNYGGGIFFLNHDFYFYTWANVIDFRQEFRGSITPSILRQSAQQIGQRFPILSCGDDAMVDHRPRWSCQPGYRPPVANCTRTAAQDGSRSIICGSGQRRNVRDDFIKFEWGCLQVVYEDDRAVQVLAHRLLESYERCEGVRDLA